MLALEDDSSLIFLLGGACSSLLADCPLGPADWSSSLAGLRLWFVYIAIFRLSFVQFISLSLISILLPVFLELESGGSFVVEDVSRVPEQFQIFQINPLNLQNQFIFLLFSRPQILLNFCCLTLDFPGNRGPVEGGCSRG